MNSNPQIIFNALPVGKGDAFLLQDEMCYILVDGGHDEGYIINLLDKENIPNNTISLLICTHYDYDHINGVIGVLQSPQYTVSEVWLPELFGSIAYSVSMDVIYQLTELQCVKTKKGELPDTQGEPSISREKLPKIRQCINCCITSDKIKLKREELSLLKRLIKVIDIVISVSNVKVKWLKYSSKQLDTSLGYNMIGVNSEETTYQQLSPKDILFALSKINQESLVFKYEGGSIPNILFSADSDFSFCSSISLKDNSIITSPHHGSDNNAIVYGKVRSTSPIYVRSDSKTAKRPCDIYINQEEKYCTICNSNNRKVIVTLYLHNGKFVTKNKVCTCG